MAEMLFLSSVVGAVLVFKGDVFEGYVKWPTGSFQMSLISFC